MVNVETVLAITSVVLAVVSLVLSLVYYFVSSRLNQETRQFLVKLETIAEKTSSQQDSMIRSTWNRLVDQALASKDTLLLEIRKGLNSEYEGQGLLPEKKERREVLATTERVVRRLLSTDMGLFLSALSAGPPSKVETAEPAEHAAVSSDGASRD